MRIARIISILLMPVLLILTACSSTAKIEKETSALSGVSKEIDIVSVQKSVNYDPMGFDPLIAVSVKYNKNTVPQDIYIIDVVTKSSDGIVISNNSVRVSWDYIPSTISPLKTDKILEFSDRRIHQFMVEQGRKPISERKSIHFEASVRKETPYTSPNYIPKQDEVVFSWEDPGSHLGYVARLSIMNVSKSGTYTVTFTGTYVVGGAGVETVSQYIGVGGSYEFYVVHRGKKVINVEYAIEIK